MMTTTVGLDAASSSSSKDKNAGGSSTLARNLLLLIGVVFHAVYIASIFDIYFTSPLVHGMGQHQLQTMAAPAQRLVLLVTDGLRADRLFEPPLPHEEASVGRAADGSLTRAPFLHDVITQRGAWGVSHTRVPTESRPGHVAVIAGFYEDVSAVTKGWKMNPVNFDSVFNQSEHTWSFGSPDILPMFAEGASDPQRVETIMYSAHEQHFARGKYASVLDTWVFDRFRELFERAKTDSTLRAQLAKPRIVFFLHLLGLDTNGHAFRPSSPEYLNNIRSVDEGIRRMEALVEQYYEHDQKTAYVLTSDHGMGNRGAHGDGDPDNTRIPLIAWGAGIRGPIRDGSGHDAFSAPWTSLHPYARQDVEQAATTPLMAALVGLRYPVNSVGVLPLDYLSGGEEFKARSAYTNARQVLEQFLVKEECKRRTEIAFRPYAALKDPGWQQIVATIERQIEDGQFKEAEEASISLIHECLSGLRYYQTYDWLFLRSLVAIGYLGWIAYSVLFIIDAYVIGRSSQHLTTQLPDDEAALLGNGHVDVPRQPQVARHSKLVDLLMAVIGLVLLGTFAAQQSPTMYYVYAAFPLFFWRQVLQRRHLLVSVLMRGVRTQRWRCTACHLLLLVVALEVLVYSYFERKILAVCLALLVIWPLVKAPRSFIRRHRVLIAAWTVACLATALFPLLPVEKGDDLRLVVAGNVGALLLGIGALWRLHTLMPSTSTVAAYRINFLQLFLVAASLLVTVHNAQRLARREGLSRMDQYLAWAILAVSLATPAMASQTQHYLHRLTTIFLAFAPTFTLLSISYEMLFYVSFAALLGSWMLLERRYYAHQSLLLTDDITALDDGKQGLQRALRNEDLRIAAIFLLMVNTAFFGTGNVASISSFNLSSVYRLTTTFNPFLMGALLVFKLLIPFFLLSSVLGVLNRTLDLPPFSLFLLVLSTTDVMTLNFFYLVRDHGSWLEIGMSISHFCISSSFVVMTILLFCFSHWMLGSILLPHSVLARHGKVH